MDSVSGIPVVDFSAFSIEHEMRAEPTSDEAKELGKNIIQAFSTVGFVYLTNHGIPQNKIDQVLEAMDGFFALDEKVKLSYELTSEEDGVPIGWRGTGTESFSYDAKSPRDMKEAFSVTPDSLGEIPWPETEVPAFKPAITSLWSLLSMLSVRVLSAMAIGLGLDSDAFKDFHWITISSPGEKRRPYYVMRMNYYPEISRDFQAEPGQARIGAHTDFGSITLLIQDDSGGLEVQTVEGQYVPATPIKGTIIVNIGDLMQRWTSDALKSNYHRVLIPPQGSPRRRSVGFFVHPLRDAVITCLDGSEKYPPVRAEEYVSGRVREMTKGKM